MINTIKDLKFDEADVLLVCSKALREEAAKWIKEDLDNLYHLTSLEICERWKIRLNMEDLN